MAFKKNTIEINEYVELTIVVNDDDMFSLIPFQITLDDSNGMAFVSMDVGKLTEVIEFLTNVQLEYIGE